MLPKTIQTTTASLNMIGEDTLCIRFKPHVVLDLNHLVENREAIFELIGEKQVYVLSVPFNDTLISKEFRETFTNSPERQFKKGEAIVITSLAQQLVAAHVKKTPNRHYPLEMFSDEQSALEWIAELKLDNL